MADGARVHTALPGAQPGQEHDGHQALVPYRELAKVPSALVSGLTRSRAQSSAVALSWSEDGAVSLAAGELDIPLSGVDPEAEAPPEEVVEGEVLARVDAGALTEAVQRVITSADRGGNGLPMLTGLHLVVGEAHVRVECTDRFRASGETVPARETAPEAGEQFALVSARQIGRAVAHFPAGEVRILRHTTAGHPGITLRSLPGQGALELTVSMDELSAEFPQLHRLRPDATAGSTLELDRKQLVTALQQATAVLEAKDTPDSTVRLTQPRPGVVTVQPDVSPECAMPELAVTGSLPDGIPAVGFTPRYLQDALRHVDSSVVTMQVTDPARPVMLTPQPHPSDAQYWHLVMPKRL